MDVIDYLAANIFLRILAMKYIISTPLMREKPVRSPMVPPIADSWSTNLAAWSCSVTAQCSDLNYLSILPF